MIEISKEDYKIYISDISCKAGMLLDTRDMTVSEIDIFTEKFTKIMEEIKREKQDDLDILQTVWNYI